MAATHSACQGVSQGLLGHGSEIFTRGQVELASQQGIGRKQQLCTSFQGRKLPLTRGARLEPLRSSVESTKCGALRQSEGFPNQQGRGRSGARRQGCRAVSVAEPQSAEAGEPGDRLRASEAAEAAEREALPPSQDGASYFSGRQYFPLAAVVGQVFCAASVVNLLIVFVAAVELHFHLRNQPPLSSGAALVV